jgi:hypothetical protein
MKSKNAYNKPCFKTVYLGEKVAHNVATSFGYFIFKQLQGSPIGKNHPIWSPCQ